MTAPLVVPFNFNPTSVSVRTSSYTIPAGRYAKVFADCDSGGIFTINGVNALVTFAFLNVDQTASSGVTYTVPSGYVASVSAIQSAGSVNLSVNANLNETLAVSRYSTIFSIGPSGTMSLSNIGGGSYCVQGSAVPSGPTNRAAEFFLPTGTVISGTGNWRAVVMEFNNIS